MGGSDPDVAKVAALIGDPARANILRALLDGRARTAKELSLAAGVTAQTTSGHLAKLVDGGLLGVAAQGRHRYFHLAGEAVAAALESLMALAGERPVPRHHHLGRVPAKLRGARTCYDHLAGELAVALFDRLLASGCLAPRGTEDFVVTAAGRQCFMQLGIDVDAVAGGQRRFARACLDWSERRPHLAGALGAALAARCFALGWIERDRTSRAVRLTPAGRAGLARCFGLDPGMLAPPP